MSSLPLHIRPAREGEFAALEEMVIACFEPVTWARPLDGRFGPLNGLDWRERWRQRLAKVFAEQIVLVGEADGSIAAVSTSTYDARQALAYLDILAVAQSRQGQGCGREMLRGTMAHFRSLGAKYINLDCLAGNGKANDLYRSEGFEEVARHIRWFRAL
jgi:ribosomal protein S18 acetylase RimI-like enzyme